MLYPYQRAGVRWLLAHPHGLLADEQGLGKSAQALLALHEAGGYPVLIVCPASVKLSWLGEIERWLSQAVSAGIAYGNHPLPAADIVVANYELLDRLFDAFAARPWRTIIFDESSYLKSYQAKRTKAAQALASAATIEHLWLLSGTPILNRPSELISQLKLLGILDQLGGFWYFARRYCQAHRNRFGLDLSGASQLDELNRRLGELCMLRRTKAEVLPELPARRVIRVPLEVALDDYQQAAREVTSWACRQRGLPAAQRATGAEKLTRINLLRQLAGRAKLEAAAIWARQLIETTGDKLVLFAHHRDIQAGLAARLPGSATITGDDSAEARSHAIARFQKQPACKTFIGSLHAAGLGITLTAGCHVAFAELDWTPAIHQQAIDRLHRIGQSRDVTGYYLVAPETIDERIWELLESKQQVVSQVTGDPLDFLLTGQT